MVLMVAERGLYRRMFASRGRVEGSKPTLNDK